MHEIQHYEILVIGSGEAGKWMTWTMAQAGHRTAVERKHIGGSCPNIACLPSKNVIRSAKANWFARHAAEYGIQTGPVSTDMRGVFSRKRKMVQGEVQFHLDRFKATGAELIKGEARFVAPKTVEVSLPDGGKRMITGDRVFLDLGSRSMIPDIPGLAAAKPMTHVEALDLQRLPEHLIVLGGTRCARVHQSERAIAGHRARRLGYGGLCRQPPVYACCLRRFPSGPRQSKRR